MANEKSLCSSPSEKRHKTPHSTLCSIILPVSYEQSAWTILAFDRLGKASLWCDAHFSLNKMHKLREPRRIYRNVEPPHLFSHRADYKYGSIIFDGPIAEELTDMYLSLSSPQKPGFSSTGSQVCDLVFFITGV
jgi:hypothetical protein